MGVGQPLALYAVDDGGEPLLFAVVAAVVEPERLLLHVGGQVLRLDGDIRPFESAFQTGSKILNGVGVDAIANESVLRMVDGVVLEPQRRYLVIDGIVVGKEYRFLFGEVACDDGQDVGGVGAGDNLGDNAAPALDHAKHWRLVLVPALLEPRDVLILEPSADVGFIGFHDAGQRYSGALHGLPEPVEHEPCRFLGDVDSAGDFMAGDPVSTVDQHQHNEQPLSESDR